MEDIYHSGRLYVVGLDDGQFASLTEPWNRYSVEAGLGVLPVGAFYHAFNAPPGKGYAYEETQELIGSTFSSLFFYTDPSYNDDARQAWADAVGFLMEQIMAFESVTAGALECDEGYIVGYWQGNKGVVNTTIGRLGYSLRQPLTTVLINRFEAARITTEHQDLGDLPGGISTANEA